MTVPSYGSNSSSLLGGEIPHDKAALNGHSGVGKTTLFMWFKEGRFVDDVSPRFNGEYNKKWNIGGKDASITLFDTAENNGPSPTVYFRRAKVVILVYDITNSDTFRALSEKENEAKDKARDEYLTLVLVGNKLDLEDDRVVSTRDGKNFAFQKGIPDEHVFEVSAKTGEGVMEMFDCVAKIISNIQVKPVKSSTPRRMCC